MCPDLRIGTTSAPRLLAGVLSLVLLAVASCAPAPVSVPTAASATVAPPPTAIPHAPEIRFALVGRLVGGNVWATFDSAGYSYNDYAIRSDYWPRLYHLTVPDARFEPLAAAGMPSAVEADGAQFAARVPLRPDLKWSDGSPFSAEDVAFTVNTALAFQLGFDWHAYYDPASLDHAEALDAHTVKFVFKQPPNVGVWQYGALQGPVVQKAYWEPKLAAASKLLPTGASLAQIDALASQVTQLQQRVNSIIAEGMTSTGEGARQLQLQLRNQQGDLDAARNDLAAAQATVDASTQSAREALYAVSSNAEPTLGAWLPGGQKSGTWINLDNPAHPFGVPSFDRAAYTLYPTQAAALQAVKQGEAEALLAPGGISESAASSLGSDVTLTSNATSLVRMLVINPARPELAAPALRLALFCSISRKALADPLDAAPLTSLVPAGSPWSNPGAVVACPNGYDPLTGADQPWQAAAILKSAGYTWTTEPAVGQPGAGLLQPGGMPLRPFALLAPNAASDPQSAAAAQAVERSARLLGIPLTVQSVDAADIRFALLNGHDYDFAIAGWRLGAYPGYLCDWFGSGNPLGYSDPQVASECAAFQGASDLDAARQRAFQIQSILAQDPVFIPIFSVRTYDITRGIVYSFDRVTNGLSGVYGVPSLAVPSAPAK